MPGFEVFGEEERMAINDLFDANGGILFAHGFDAMRADIYRVREFEQAFAARMGVPHAQAVSSGSTALKVGLKALGVKPGDEVITTAFTFVATVESVLEVGARPVIVNINKTLNIDPGAIEAAITPQTAAIIVVHMMGAPAEMEAIIQIADRHQIPVLEDNAQCCGGTYHGKTLGTLGAVGTFSFDGGKTMTTGEGGMVVTSREDFYLRARAYHDHGHEYSTTVGRGAEGALITGFNYRMMELQGAIGLVQLGKLDDINRRQRENKQRLKGLLRDLPVEFRPLADEEGEIGDAVIFYLASREVTEALARRMADYQMGTKNLPDALRWHFARHWQHMYSEYDFYADSFETQWQASADILERAIALPVMVNMTPDTIETWAENLHKIADELIG